MLENVKADYLRVLGPKTSAGRQGIRVKVSSFFNYGFLSIAIYRYGKWASRLRVPVVAQLIRASYAILKMFCEILFGISINVHSDIGKGFKIAHFSNIIVNGHMGENCSVGQGVTLGTKGAGKSDGVPTLGNNVYVAAGAKIIGSVTLGDNVVVGANAVVVSDIPSDSVAVGIPAVAKPRRD